MKITINLTDEEVRGIKAYLKETDDNPKPSKKDIEIFVDNLVQIIHSPMEAVSTYIQAEEKKNLPYNVGTIYQWD
jgi:transcription antitermination factor NusG